MGYYRTRCGRYYRGRICTTSRRTTVRGTLLPACMACLTRDERAHHGLLPNRRQHDTNPPATATMIDVAKLRAGDYDRSDIASSEAR